MSHKPLSSKLCYADRPGIWCNSAQRSILFRGEIGYDDGLQLSRYFQDLDSLFDMLGLGVAADDRPNGIASFESAAKDSEAYMACTASYEDKIVSHSVALKTKNEYTVVSKVCVQQNEVAFVNWSTAKCFHGEGDDCIELNGTD